MAVSDYLISPTVLRDGTATPIPGAVGTINTTVYADQSRNALLDPTQPADRTGTFSPASAPLYAAPGAYTIAYVDPAGVARTAAVTVTGPAVPSSSAPITPSDPAGGDAALAASLSATYSPLAQGRPGNRVAFLGDSITSGSGAGQQDTSRPYCFPTYASLMSKQRVFLARNAGKAGDTTAQMLARFDTDVTPYLPSAVVILGGTNDTAQSIPLATIQTNIKAIIAKCVAIGAQPVLCTIPPNSTGTPADRKSRIVALNTWLRRYAALNGWTVLDFYNLLIDATNGNYLSAYSSGDGTHPNEAGYAAMGAYVSTTLAPLLPAWSPPIPSSQDPYNLVSDGLFQTVASGVSTSWTNGGTQTGVTPSAVADTAIKGQWQRLTFAAGATGVPLFFQNVGTAVVVGHVYAFMGRIQTSGVAGSGVTYQARLRVNGYSDYVAAATLGQDVSDGIFYIEGLAGVGSTSNQLSLQFANPSGWASGGYVQIAQVGLYDLTAMGIAPTFAMGPTT